jgi:hypothetical protein
MRMIGMGAAAMRKMLGMTPLAGLIPALISLATPADALTITVRGSDLYLSGFIELGDHAKFEAVMMANRGRLRTVHLNSRGGWSGDMREIARDIRKAGLNTAVDGSRAICASACTVLFAAGAQRFYYNADRVAEGVRKADGGPGLGYHGAGNSRDTIRMAGQSPGAGMQGVINMYYEMGSPAGANLANQAAFTELNRINGRTALALGIATSLSRP